MEDTSRPAELNGALPSGRFYPLESLRRPTRATALPKISITDSEASFVHSNESPTVHNKFWNELTEEIQLQTQESSNDSDGDAEREVGSASPAVRQGSKGSDIDACSTVACPPSPRQLAWDETDPNYQRRDIRNLDDLYDADEDNGNWI